jgi:serine/threonine protein kinase
MLIFGFSIRVGDSLAVDLLQRLITMNSDKRISADEALKHAYFTSPPLPSDPKKYDWGERERKMRIMDKIEFLYLFFIFLFHTYIDILFLSVFLSLHRYYYYYFYDGRHLACHNMYRAMRWIDERSWNMES